MKRFYIIIAILCSFITAQAQIGLSGGGGPAIVGKISGTLIDSLTKKPVDYASVSLYRSGGKAPITGVITDEKGEFKLDNIKPGSYKITFTFIGYPDKVIDPVTTTAGKPDNNLGTVLFAPSAKVLKEVQVTGQAALIENKIDKIVYNAEKDITSAGGNATDLLGKVPLVTVDINGNVSVRGDQNVRVLINGKPSGATSTSLSDVLKAIPAAQIKSIEVITSPSAKYDAEGSAGIINIITKSKNVSGISGQVSAAVGTRQNNGNFNLNYSKNRFNFSANLGGNLTWPQTSITSFDQQIDLDTVHTHTTSNGTSRVTRHATNSSLSAGYEFNAYNSITSSFKLLDFNFNTNGNTSFQSATPYNNHLFQHNEFSNFDWNLDYTHKYKLEGEELDLSTQWSHGSGITNFTNTYSGVFDDLQNNLNGKNNEYTVQLDYTLPISKTLKLEAGGKSIFRRINSTSNYFNDTNNSGDFTFNPLLSNIYKYNQNVYAGYTVFTITLPKKWSVMAGVRDENTDIKGEPINESQALSPFTQNYNTFVPSLTIQKALNAKQTIKLAYSKRITRPSLQFLNPFVNQVNIQSQTQGNPRLNPEISQTVELDYNAFIGTSILNLSGYYKHTDNLIENIARPISVIVDGIAQGGTLTTFQNIGSNNSFGGNVFGTINPFKALTIIMSVNAYTYKPDPSGVFHLDQTQNGTYIQYGGFARASLTLPKDYVAEAFVFGNSPRHTIQGTTPTFSILGIGAKKQFMQKRLAIGVNVIEPFSEYKSFNSNLESPGFKQSSKFQMPFRSYGLTFSYSFGKLNFSNPNQQKKGLNDDLKQGDQGMGGGGAQGGGGR
ncbi:TonB-dependent receptor [Mucilaginibacter sp. L3T2-6]|uniref:TonB-dependent receptor domain-containing protein n=1 Tax=Mucilaginibacter sp. L3T2-6 TaxID=3062491 RepID=UPI00267642D9|nr:TonB-dependent receptor [Mucilaginibacter sp. L3T2-6]MDO3642644.1 TonB-dependent receptor [Mucilaginibacter sp. L3T2-6]MDV6214960.1 TonB-dependent receptor [Mucilaginibacter sp. L3T2-6]